MESVSPNIFVSDISATIDYYKDLGFEKTFYGASEFSILDLKGYMLTFAEMEENG